MKAFLFDLESTGLLRQGSQLHCIVCRDLKDQTADPIVFDTAQGNIDEGIKFLEEADVLAGHNIISYDIALINELYPNFKCPKFLIDTLILSRLYLADLTERDFRRRHRGLPVKLYGSHSLKAHGIRLGCLKGDFGETSDWSTYSEEMKNYCIQDVAVNLELFTRLVPLIPETENPLL